VNLVKKLVFFDRFIQLFSKGNTFSQYSVGDGEREYAYSKDEEAEKECKPADECPHPVHGSITPYFQKKRNWGGAPSASVYFR